METVKQIYKRLIAVESTNMWLQNIPDLSFIYVDTDYRDSHSYIDRYFSNKFKDLIIDDDLLDADCTYNDLVREVKSCMYANAESIKRMYEIVKAEYSPIENVDRYEEMDKVTTTNDMGLRKQTNKTDKTKNTTTSSTTGFNNGAGYVPENKVESETTGQGANGEINSMLTTDAVIDTTTVSGTGTDGKIFNHIHGNIGVTESTTMLEHHADFWKWFNFYEYIYKLVFAYLGIGIYADSEEV